MSLNHLYEPTTPAASEIVRAIRVMEGPAAVELLRDAMDMAYLKGKMDGVNEGFSLVVKPVSEIMEEAERAREAEIQDASLRRALAKAAEMIAR